MNLSPAVKEVLFQRGFVLALKGFGVYILFKFIYLLFFSFWNSAFIYFAFQYAFYGVIGLMAYVIVGKPLLVVLNEEKAIREYQLEEQRQNEARVQQERIMYENRIDVRMKKTLEAYPEEASKTLQAVAKQVFAKHNGIEKQQPLKQVLSSDTFKPKTIRVDNDERFNRIQSEARKLENFLPDEIKRQSNNGGHWFNVPDSEGIPLEFMLSNIIPEGLSKRHIDAFYQELTAYQAFREEASLYLDKEVRVIGAGVKGENRVNEELEMYGKAWNAFSNIRFEVNGQSVESDNIIVSKKGIFTIEAKNYSPNGTYGIRITKDGQWLKTFSNGRVEPMNNIASQSNRHVAYKQRLISDKYEAKHGDNKFFHIQPLIVIANDTVQVENETDMPIMRISQIYHHIMSQPDILTEDEIAKISEIIKENALPPKKYPLDCYFPGIETIHETLTKKVSAIRALDVMFDEYVKVAQQELERLEMEQNKR